MLKTFALFITVIILGYGLFYFQKFDLVKIVQIIHSNDPETNHLVQISGQAMIPNYLDGQQWLVDKHAYDASAPQRGDVVLFRSISDPSLQMAKRVVGLPSEEVEIREDKIYLNGEILDEPYLTKDIMTYSGDFLKQNIKVIIPPDNYLILGDNRSHSADSRTWGFLPKENIAGKLTSCYKNCN